MSRRSMATTKRIAALAGGALVVAGAYWGTVTARKGGEPTSQLPTVASVAIGVGDAQAQTKPAPLPPIGAPQKPYSVSINTLPAKAGQASVATVTIKSAGGYHFNKEYPTSLKLAPPAGVTTPKPMLKKEDAKLAENEGIFSVSLTAAAAGKLTVPGTLRFAVCTESTCEPQTEQIAIAMDVK